MPGIESLPRYLLHEATKAFTSVSGLSFPINDATSSVKKSAVSTNGATVPRLIWSASTKYLPAKPSAATAASASLRTSAGCE